MVLDLIRRLVPRRLLLLYHRWLATFAALRYGRPSRKMVVIGVTGTDGKTTTALLISQLLQAAGKLVGLSSGVYFQTGQRRWRNEMHMTMPGRMRLHRLLRQMVDAGCQYAVIEVSSEGLLQHRHLGIDFDAAVLTNLTAEHLETHGGLAAYRRTKGRLFHQIIRSGDKRLDGLPVKKFTVVNLDDASAEYFLGFWAEEHHGVTLRDKPATLARVKNKLRIWRAESVKTEPNGSQFVVERHHLRLPLPGRYNVYNALEAVVTAAALGIDWSTIERGLAQASHIPGRWEEFALPNGARAIVDYALTPAALVQFYQAVEQFGSKRIIAVFGAAGGGRDRWKRPDLGEIASRHASVIILTTDDPYDEDPGAITGEIAAGISAASRAEVFMILDRREAIRRALSLAQPDDVVAITGMGAETSMVIKGKKVPWSDADTVKELIASLG
ncbi:MAG: UDP-N-acetylmuramoyl-L-alanyl-D-glutamate--2,6-diaminopimelate ligase [Candidatus Kerfeldbacteria bacterium]|nr:UDP-N-acetylmuramoyl-L-alanyl-D-glutamate--2,6-diaminopimelate ligase [Candidatus Kerfeldbacteria bacterium]